LIEALQLHRGPLAARTVRIDMARHLVRYTFVHIALSSGAAVSAGWEVRERDPGYSVVEQCYEPSPLVPRRVVTVSLRLSAVNFLSRSTP
jgi:hypothetical protein